MLKAPDPDTQETEDGDSRRSSGVGLLSLVLGFAIIYFVWGSTYLAIKFAIETLPPFSMAGTRFLSAGLLMYGVLVARGAPRPDLTAWKSAALIGSLMLLGGNGLVTWSEQWVPSGVAALIVSTIPLWMVLLEWRGNGGRRPTLAVTAGLIVGFAGVALLVDPATLEGGESAIWPFLAVLAAPLLWAIGSMRSRAMTNNSPLLASAMQMILGGVLLLTLGAVSGELQDFDPSTVSARSINAFVYLAVMGSIVAFSAYTWLIRVASPSAVSTYAYVNPLVAVLLGWGIGDEEINAKMIAATPLIVGAVALITLKRKPRAAIATEAAPVPQPAQVRRDA